MPSDNHAVPVNYNRLLPSEFSKAVCYILNSRLVMARVIFIRPDLVQPLFIDLHKNILTAPPPSKLPSAQSKLGETALLLQNSAMAGATSM